MRYLTEEETDIASRFLYLDTAIKILQKKESPAFYHAIKVGIEERRKLKKVFLERKIKVVHMYSEEHFVCFMFYIGIRQQERKYFRPALTKHVKKVVEELLRQN